MDRYEKYLKTASTLAKVFQPGDEDGFEEDGTPFVNSIEAAHFLGEYYENYICKGVNGERWLVAKDIFEKTYEKV